MVASTPNGSTSIGWPSRLTKARLHFVSGKGGTGKSTIAASLALAVVLPRGGSDDAPGALSGELASALDSQLSATQHADADTRILLSFANAEGDYCRAFTAPEVSGIACREADGWQLERLATGSEAGASEYRQAGSDVSDILAAAQEMARGGALDAEAEAAARAKGWRD